MPRFVVLFAAFLLSGLLADQTLVGQSQAQGLNFVSQTEAPIEVLADNGIEWEQDGSRFVARGNAVASRGNVKVEADVLIAYYRKDGGSTEIYRLDARGNVTISSPTEKATGDVAIYDVDQAVLVLNGKSVRLTTPNQVITATQSLEYFEARKLAVARGNATATQEGRKIEADVLTAHFEAQNGAQNSSGNGGGPQQISRLEAFGNVRIKTARETVTGAKGNYNAKTGIATLEGSVKITRADDKLAGELAVVNMTTGVSTLYGSKEGAAGQGRVRAVIAPKQQN